jgi:hypothetical protein
MATKSRERTQGDATLATAGLAPGWATFMDRGKLGTRIKYSFIRPTAEQLAKLARSWAARWPGRRTEVYMGGTTYPGGYPGLCLKVYN